MRILSLLIVHFARAALTIGAACGSSSRARARRAAATRPRSARAGDIPDNQAFVAYSPPGGGFTVKVPEGWARSADGRRDDLHRQAQRDQHGDGARGAAPTVRDARQTELPKLARQVKGFTPGTVTLVTRKAGPAVRITYLAAAPADPVTGKARTNAVERYVFFHNGKDVVLTLSGPKGADNVDPWRIVTDSLRWSR